MKREVSRLAAWVLFIGLTAGVGVRAQNPGQTARDPLAGLKRALASAGAPALTSAQESELNALITARRAALEGQTPSTVLQTAQLAYNDAILASNLAAAQAQADLIANEQAGIARTALKDSAKFQIDVLNVLKSNGAQYSLLLGRLGTQGVSRLLASLSPGGGPRGPGRGVGRPPLPGRGGN